MNDGIKEKYIKLQADHIRLMGNYIKLLAKMQSEAGMRCGECGIEMTEVSPGKFQCDNGECLNYG